MFRFPKIQNLINFLANPSILAILITVAIIPFLPDYSKYKVKLIDSGGKPPDNTYLYEDLNNDGKSERIIILNNPKSVVATIIYEDSKIIDQWNYTGEYTPMIHHFFGDYDNNGLKEMYVFTCKNDSLFLWITEVFSGKEILTERFIIKHFRYEDNIDIFIPDIQLIRGNNENKMDLFFVTNSGFSYRSRKLFIYSIEKDSLISTLESASCFDIPFLFNIDNDQRMEFFGRIPAYANSPSDFPYTDSFAWIIAYDHDLSFLFEPIQIGTYPGRVTLKPYFFDDRYYLVALYSHFGKNDNSKLFIITLDGQLIKQIEIELEEEGVNLLTMQDNENNKILLHYSSLGILKEYDFNLDLISSRKIVQISNYKFQVIDIDNDNIVEQIGHGKDLQSLVIFRSDFSHPVIIPFLEAKAGPEISVKRDGDKNELFLSFDNYWYHLWRYILTKNKK